jgi:hypothetical protein
MRRVAAIFLLVSLLCLPLRGGRTTNGTSDYLQGAMAISGGIFPLNIVGQPQGTVSFVHNLIAFPAAGGSLPACGVHCGEIVNVVAGHNAATNGCQTTTGACLDIFVCPTTPCASNRILVDITTPNVGEAETAWAMSVGGPHVFTFLLNRTAANMQLYIDGALQTILGSSTAGDPGPINYIGAGCGLCDVTVMASEGGTPAPDNFTNGTIGDLAFWNVTLSANEIQSLARCVPPNRVQPEHVSYYPIYGTDPTEPNFNPFLFGASPTIQPIKLTLHGTTAVKGNQSGCQPGGAYAP